MADLPEEVPGLDSEEYPEEKEPFQESNEETTDSAFSDGGHAWGFVIGLGALLLVVIWALMLIPRRTEVKPVPVPAPILFHPPAPAVLVDQLVKEIQDGELPSLQEEGVIGLAGEYKMHDQLVNFKHEPTDKYLEKIVDFLHLKSNASRSFFSIKIKLHNDHNINGAKTGILPNGAIFYAASSILRAQNEAEVAGILAHEIGHLVSRHYAKERRAWQNVTRLENKFIKEANLKGMIAIRMAKDRLWGTMLLPGSMDTNQQLEADKKGQEILRDAGYESDAFLNLLHAYTVGISDITPRILMNQRTREAEKNQFQGKSFIVATPEEFRAIQKNLKNFLDKQK
ncbi:MAG: M48 family metalloprotease [bacterium]|nr:M48 family metalloprotease [bacterium]